ncbi:MAG: aminoacyltransferase [Patescibacteria group bacterium]|nr:aminoacyltransferase [Patescibacteria group bacterium]
MEIKEIKEKEVWQTFISSFEMAPFLQSWEWGDFQESLGRKIWRLGFFKNDQLIGITLLIRMLLPIKKSYLYCPRGPILRENNIETIKIFFRKINDLAKKENIIFLRFEPLDNFQVSIFNFSFKKINDLQPSKTILLDLTKSEKEILENMHPKTRYNIKLAEKKGVRIKIGQSEEEIEIFLKLLSQTAQRDRFQTHPFNYYRKMFRLDKNFIKLFFAEYQGKIIAGNLMIFFADTATYLHGASDHQHRNVMAPYLLHWTAIKEAKRLCLKYYDFWGIDEKKWPGVTRFKKGFGGEIKEYPGTFDSIFNYFWYRLYQLGRILKKI